jgi:hypothetical protein
MKPQRKGGRVTPRREYAVIHGDDGLSQQCIFYELKAIT